MQAKADLHVHSKYSNRPSEWLLRRIGAPESFVEPNKLYESARKRGMDFVTITDHNCIDGALEIASLPNTFLSSEVTTYFPEDGCKIHCLVFGITERQFAKIQELRENIYDLQVYLNSEGIIHSVSHPLFSVNDRLSVSHIEKLLVLFNRFEGINGTRDPRAANLVNAVFKNLSVELIADLAALHGLEPVGATPWLKTFTGGSDDHSGLYVASAYTVTPETAETAVFLDHLRHGNHEMAGCHGTSVRLAHSFYHIASSFYRSKVLGNSSGKPSLIGNLLEKLIEEPSADSRLSGGMRRFVTRVVLPWRTRKLRPIEKIMMEEFSLSFGDQSLNSSTPDGIEQADRSFILASRLSQQLAYTFLKRFTGHLKDGEFLESLQTFASLAPVGLGIAPYLAAFATQHKDKMLLDAVARRFAASKELTGCMDRQVWVADNLLPVQPMMKSIAGALMCGETTLLTCQQHSNPTAERPGTVQHNIQPVGTFELAEFGETKLPFPPFLEVIRFLEEKQFTEIFVSTPGPLGINALAAGRLLGIKVTGFFQTGLPEKVKVVTGDDYMSQLAWYYLGWFFGQMHHVLVPDHETKDKLVELGVDIGKVVVLTAGEDVSATPDLPTVTAPSETRAARAIEPDPAAAYCELDSELLQVR